MAKKKTTKSKPEPELPYLHWIVVGDWSNDGHNEKEFISFRCTHDEAAVQKAYLAACKKGNVALHEEHKKDDAEHIICCSYQEQQMTPEARRALKELGVDLTLLQDYSEEDEDSDEGTFLGPQDIVAIFAEMVRTQIDGFAWEFPESSRLPTLNGYWKKGFNLQFGYGVLGD